MKRLLTATIFVILASILMAILTCFIISKGNASYAAAWVTIGIIFFIYFYCNFFILVLNGFLIKDVAEANNKINMLGTQLLDVEIKLENLNKKGKN